MAAQARPGMVVDERYEIQALLFEGRVTTIWQAYDRHMERHVALKTLVDLNRVTRLYHEALTVSTLEHPHLIPIYDYSTTSEIPYLVMRLISDQSLEAYLEKNEFSMQEWVRLAQRLADALDYLRQQRVIHGDFRPANILIGDQKHPYLTNFAISTTLDAAGSAINVGQGSRYYMAPEQLGAASIDYRADLYAFGIVLYEALTGKPVFGRGGTKDSLAARQQINPDTGLPSVRALRPEIPIGVDTVLDRLTRFDPAERYSTATEAAEALTRAFYSGEGSIEGQIFLSYARKDSEYVYKLAKELQRIGVPIWIDQDIEPGANWDAAIEKALETCDKMLLIVSPASVKSENVQDEWSYFLEEGKAVYPFIYQETSIPFRLRRRQHITSTGDLLSDVARIVELLSGGTPTKLMAEDR